ncbi:hypothetical protein [Nocardioides sp. SR21]|uniref:hypothetical protein n=1 Tax=Nocardioides sp. SR21 TaxID=2919501 RepID=UPI001FAA7939|nr:hypothetical protein [Nocardioides sp. SR21]
MKAADVYELAVERHRHRWTRPLHVIGALTEAVLWGRSHPPSAGDLVVRRRADNVVVVRFADDHVSYFEVENQLSTMSVVEFQEAWGIHAGTVEA